MAGSWRALEGSPSVWGKKKMWLWVKTQETPGEHRNRRQMDVHPPQNGAIGYAPWPCGLATFEIPIAMRSIILITHDVTCHGIEIGRGRAPYNYGYLLRVPPPPTPQRTSMQPLNSLDFLFASPKQGTSNNSQRTSRKAQRNPSILSEKSTFR